MFDKTVWSPKPCVTCLCSGGNVVCDEMLCPVLQCPLKFKPIGQCCPICLPSSEYENSSQRNDHHKATKPFTVESFSPAHDLSETSGESPVPNDPSIPDPATSPVHEETLRRQKYREEEEQLLRKDAERKRRKKQKDAEKRRKQLEEHEDELKRRRLEEEEEEKKRVEEQNRAEEEEEMTVWLRGDVFEMSPEMPRPPPSATSEPEHTTERVDEEESVRISYSLPPGCSISDVIVSCENAKLTSIPPLSIPELKSLSLQGKMPTQRLCFNTPGAS